QWVLRPLQLVHELESQPRLCRAGQSWLAADDAGAVHPCELRLCLRDARLAPRRTDAAQLRQPYGGDDRFRPLDGAGETGRGQCGAGEVDGYAVSRAVGRVVQSVLPCTLRSPFALPAPLWGA